MKLVLIQPKSFIFSHFMRGLLIFFQPENSVLRDVIVILPDYLSSKVKVPVGTDNLIRGWGLWGALCSNFFFRLPA